MFDKYIFPCELSSGYYMYIVSCYIAAAPHIDASDQMPIPQPSVPRHANEPFPHKMWVLSFYQLWVTEPGWGLQWDCVYLLSLFAQCEIAQPVFMFCFLFPREHCFIYSCGWYVSGKSASCVASPPAAELVYVLYILMHNFLCVFLFVFYIKFYPSLRYKMVG